MTLDGSNSVQARPGYDIGHDPVGSEAFSNVGMSLIQGEKIYSDSRFATLEKRIPFDLPSPTGAGSSPVFTGSGFTIGGKRVPVLKYGSTAQGWSDELTDFHAESAGNEHFIDVASRRIAVQQVLSSIKAKDAIVLEIGSSSGFMLKDLRAALPHATIIGSDIVCGSLERLATEMPNVPLMQFDVTACPLPDSCVDVVVALNVLEHIKDDQLALRQILRILKPGGALVLEVPAGPELYDNYDRLLCHYRRYSMKHVSSIVRAEGYSISAKSHLGCFIYPAFWAVKWLGKITEDNGPINKEAIETNIKKSGASRLIKFLTNLELKLGTAVSYPFGIRCTLTCKKPAGTN